MNQDPDWVNRLVEALQLQGNVRRKPIPAPKFDGTSDVRKFLQTFAEVAEQNQWDDQERTLHLKLALQGTAAECVQGDTADELAESLVTRFQLSREEARRELRGLKLRSGQDIHKFGNLVMKLVKMAEPDLDGEQLDDKATTELVDAIGDRFLTREFRLQGPINFADAIRRIQQYNADMKVSKIHRLEMEEDGEEKMKLLETKLAGQTKQMESLQSSLNGMQKSLEALLLRDSSATQITGQRCGICNRQNHQTKDCWERGVDARRNRKPLTCFICGKPDHLARRCPRRQQPNNQATTLNSNGPEQ